ncbi:helix-turn-helix domain-containing protein (plasmid) [Streptomyces sp. HUAS 31]|uniref:helix-turn-helix domain-containing protein n=1 Tax=Streptomyces sp. HUAS 31 TaxID=3020055 RepID=UPI00230525C2|nr:helix-turn-helix domain-containing protein [Streptomyces sp. HUAS 31]WCE02498.1 helix-turn-helix domain-containing protein [Streptomyces sp. HUAS 31]
MATRVEHFSLEGVLPQERERRWEELLSATHFATRVRLTPPGHGGGLFRASVSRIFVDDLTLVDTRCDPCSGVRGRDLVESASAGHVVMTFTHAGRETVTQDGLTGEVRRGDAVAWDSARPTRFQVWEPLAKRSLMIPRRALREVGGPSGPVCGILDGSAASTRLLAGYLELLAGSAEELSAAAAVSARNAALHLVSAALHAGLGRPGPVPAEAALPFPLRRAAVLRWIDRNLTRPGLTPAAVARAHGVSVRTLHRLFEESGETVAGVVRTRRLAGARADLASGAEPVSVIAARWGFADPSHFARAFGTAYGTTPTRYRAGGPARGR